MSKKLLETYLDELLKWNKKVNLTSITKEPEVRLKHFEDSKTLSKAYDFSKGNPCVIDVGTGAGFPGIPLKILFPNIKLTLVDSVKKKTDFLEHIVKVLGLDNVRIIWGRAEDLAKKKAFRESFDVAVSRALGHLSVDCELCMPFVKIGGVFIAMKSKNQEKEVEQAINAIASLGGELNNIVTFKLPGVDIERKLIVIEKYKKTSDKYPRKAGIPQKRPL